MPYDGVAVAFLMGSSQEIWTAAHNFETQILDTMLAEKAVGRDGYDRVFPSLIPEFLLLNESLEIVFDSRRNLSQPTYLFHGDPIFQREIIENEVKKIGLSSSAVENRNYRKKLSDFARIKLPFALPNPYFKRAQSAPPGSGEKVWLSLPTGVETKTRQAANELPNYHLKGDDLGKDLLVEKFLIYYLSHSIVGTSGSPVLNGAGDVVAIHIAGDENIGIAARLDWAEELTRLTSATASDSP
ncbi:MAG: hypothetical protein EOP11_21445 [Proteobacteria bacterium]|nr:MAG: hypothetical protein EOP11_21445 [Pseudomonadota bacterium]